MLLGLTGVNQRDAGAGKTRTFAIDSETGDISWYAGSPHSLNSNVQGSNRSMYDHNYLPHWVVHAAGMAITLIGFKTGTQDFLFGARSCWLWPYKAVAIAIHKQADFHPTEPDGLHVASAWKFHTNFDVSRLHGPPLVIGSTIIVSHNSVTDPRHRTRNEAYFGNDLTTTPGLSAIDTATGNVLWAKSNFRDISWWSNNQYRYNLLS